MTEKTADTGSGSMPPAQDAADFMTLIGAGWTRMEQLDAISKAVLRRIQEQRDAEVQLGIALLNCATPADAFILYTKWLSQRTTALMQDGPKLAELWTRLYAPPSAEKPGLSEGQREPLRTRE